MLILVCLILVYVFCTHGVALEGGGGHTLIDYPMIILQVKVDLDLVVN